MLVEYRIGKGRLLVSTLNLSEADPGAQWLKKRILDYAASADFAPECELSIDDLAYLCDSATPEDGENQNAAQNMNDITMRVKAK